MNNVAAISQNNAVDFTGRQLDLIRRTIAADTNASEFDLFIEVARRVGLDPFRRQIVPLVFSKGNAEKRKMSIITQIDGFRAIAARCANYRPDENEPEFTFDETAKGPNNPLGLVKATVTVWQQDNLGAWHPVKGWAYWDEFVPLTEKWAYDQDEGKRKPTGESELDKKSNWFRMGRVMLAKCSEAGALRKGWPEHFSGLYEEAEMDRARAADMSASQIVEAEAEARRQNAIGGKDTLIVDWLDDSELDRVPLGQFADRIMAYIEKHQPAECIMFRDRNRETFRDFWARSPNDANELKKVFERLERQASAVTIEPETVRSDNDRLRAQLEGSIVIEAAKASGSTIPEFVAIATTVLNRILATENGHELDKLLTSQEIKDARKNLPAKEWDRIASAGKKHREGFGEILNGG